MTRSTTALVLALTAACLAIGCGGLVSDGGQSGTGLSAIRGNVVAAPGVELELAGIRVSLTATDPGTHTDASGRFELRTRTSGAAELRFEREADGLFARTDVVVPTGGVLELSEIVLDPESDEARPTMRRVEFEGIVQVLDCAVGEILVTAKEDETGTVFTVEVASATIRHDDIPLTCGELRVGDRVQVDAETPDGVTLVNAEVVLEDREDETDDDSDESDDDSGETDDDSDESDDDSGETDDDSDESDDDSGETDDDSDESDDDSGETDDDSDEPDDDSDETDDDSEDKTDATNDEADEIFPLGRRS